jgi:hypothetical protein
VLAVLLAVAATGACRAGGQDPMADIHLDGSARPPDVAGVVTKVTVDDITIDAKTYRLSRNLLAFNTYSLEAIPVLRTKGSYVHAGLVEGRAVWVSEVARVLPAASGRRVGYYRGTLLAVDDGRLVFRDGTVLRPAAGVAAPKPPVAVLATIDVRSDRVVALGGA